MAEINGLGFENFRVFKDQVKFDLEPISILTGANSSGKSTIIKSLRLFQKFWEQKDFGHNLKFSESNHLHQLGNFKMCKSKSSSDSEIAFSYKVNHVLFDELFIELNFKNKNNNLNDGILTKTGIKTKDDVYLFGIEINDKGVILQFVNYDYIIKEVIPKIIELKKEYIKYLKLTNNVNPIVAHKGESCEELCHKHNIDYNRYRDLEEMFFVEFRSNYPNENEYNKSNKNMRLDEWDKLDFIYDSEIISIFNEMSVSDYTLFYESLWSHLIEKYPSLQDSYTYFTFKELLDENDIGSWTNNIIVSGEKSFADFYKKNLDEALKIVSKLSFSLTLGIIDNEESYSRKFYNPMELKIGSFSFFMKMHDILTNNKTVFNDEEQAVINSQRIIHDAIKLNKILKNEEPNFLVESLLEDVKNLLKNMTYKTIEMEFSKMYFINSIRATSQRFYSFSSSESDFHLFIMEFLRREYDEEEQDFINKWLNEFEIADKFEIKIKEGAGSEIVLHKNDEEINLVDLGYGVTQFLPILLKIAYCNNVEKRYIIIEEPETNLHPKLQSKLADLFIDAYKTLGIKFIIETHSEYLVRKLQYNTAKGAIKPEESVIHYITHSPNESEENIEKQVRTIRIKPNGQLSEPFGSGFTDESSHWIKEMFMFQAQN